MKKGFFTKLIYLFLLITAVNFAQAPIITKQPQNRGVVVGQTASFFIQAVGDSINYQWYKNDTMIIGANDSLYTTPATILSDNKSKFKCIASNSSGADTSTAATLYVTASGSRVTEGQILLYNFNEAGGDTVLDNSGYGTPLGMKIFNTSAVSWTPKGLATNDKAFIRTNSATKLVDASTASNEVTVEAWVVPAFSSQPSLSRIVTLAQDYNAQNFAIMQSGSSYVVRMRSTEPLPSAIGQGIATNPGSVTTQLTHLSFTRRSDGISHFYINGNVAWVDTGGGDLSNWIAANRFQIANDFGEGSWLGTYYLVSVYERALDQAEINANFNLGANNDRKPEIIIEPQDLGLLVGQSANFSVKYVGDSSSIIWRKNGIDIPGAIGQTYTIPSVSLLNNFEEYTCVISNSFGSDTSRRAILNVTALDSRVTNGQLALYTFQEASGDTIKDVSGYDPLNLKINNMSSVSWKPYGLFVNSPANIVSIAQATKINDSIKTKGEFSFETWVKPANLTQTPATIATLSGTSGPDFVNFVVNQDVNRLQTWFRTSTSPSSGSFLQTPPSSLGDSLIHIVYTYNKKEISKIYVNGNLISDLYMFGNLSNWNNTFFLKLADQFSISSAFRGFYNLVSFYKRELNSSEISHNFSQGPIGISLNSPSGLTAAANNRRKVELSWQDNSINEDGFTLERKTQSSNYIVIAALAANVTSFIDSTVADTTNYTYRIKAFNDFKQSGYSNEASVTTLPYDINTPSGLAASLVPVDVVRKVKLDWTDNSTNELGFAIQRKTGDSASVAPFVSIDSVNAGVVTFTDFTVTDTTTYTYRIFAFNADTVSGFSNTATISTILSTIQAPTNLAASLVPVEKELAVRKVKLDWTDNSSNELGFAIQRKTGDSASVAPFVPIDSVNAGVITFTDLTVADTTIYTYRIFAFNTDTVSGFSNTATISTILSTIQAPSNLIASLSLPDTHKVKLTWIDNSSNELGFILQRKLGDTLSVSPYLNLDTLFANATMYVDTTVQDSTTYTYRVYAFNADTVSPFSNRAQITTPVPVEFTSFTASVVSGYVSLNWTTATEINNAGFSIQRSQENNKFIDIGFIKGNGTTTTPSEYSFVDKTVQFGKYVYRLKQVDYDGYSSYSNSILVDLGLPKDFSLDQNYPNPFNPSTTIRFALPTSSNVSLILYNALGQEVHNILNTDLEAGIHEVKFNASSLSSGVYFYMLKAEGINGSSFTSTKRMILMK